MKRILLVVVLMLMVAGVCQAQTTGRIYEGKKTTTTPVDKWFNVYGNFNVGDSSSSYGVVVSTVDGVHVAVPFYVGETTATAAWNVRIDTDGYIITKSSMTIDGDMMLLDGTTIWIDTGKSVGFTVYGGSVSYTNDAGGTWSAVGSGGGGADNTARETTIVMGFFGYAYVTDQIDRYQTGAYDLYVTSFCVTVDSAPTTNPLIFGIEVSSPSGISTFYDWQVLAGTVTCPAGVRRATTTTLGSLYSAARIIKAGSRIKARIRGTGVPSGYGGNDGTVTINGIKQ